MADWQGGFCMVSNDDGDEQKITLESVTEKLQKREEERQIQLNNKKQASESKNLSVQQSVKLFLDSFHSELKQLEELLSSSSLVPSNSLVNHFDDLSQKTLKLQRVVSESAMFLPPFELQKAHQLLATLHKIIQEKRDELIPKRKFAFKSNKRTVNKAVPHGAKTSPILTDSKLDEDSIIELAACKFVGFSDEKLEKYSDDINLKDVALAELDGCDVRLYGSPSAVHINKLKNCKIFCGPVSGSIFIRECINCTFVLACHQLRIHSTTNSHFYIHVTSKAIVEDCKDVKFAPYNWDYKNLDDHFLVSGLVFDRNNWNKVDDFNWLVSNEQSPNWSLLNESDRVSSWD